MESRDYLVSTSSKDGVRVRQFVNGDNRWQDQLEAIEHVSAEACFIKFAGYRNTCLVVWNLGTIETAEEIVATLRHFLLTGHVKRTNYSVD
jgi:hypothetical protein